MAKQYAATPARNALYRRLRVAYNWAQTNLPEWRDDDYRNVLKIHGAAMVDGKYSATTMSHQQMEEAFRFFQKKGFRLQRKPTSKKDRNWRKPRIAKLNAMWCALADAGHVENKSESAMAAWCRHNVKDLTQLQWADSDQLNKAVEMLKSYCKRCDVEVY